MGIEGALVDPAFDVSHHLPADRLSQGDDGAECAEIQEGMAALGLNCFKQQRVSYRVRHATISTRRWEAFPPASLEGHAGEGLCQTVLL